MSEKQTGKFRQHKAKFAQISNAALQDEKLSLRAKGLYALIQSYITINNFVLYKSHLLKKSKEGDKAFQAAWDELKNAGFLKQYRIRCASSNSYTYEYELLDEADLSTPSLMNIGIDGKVIPPKIKEKNEPPQKGRGSNSTLFKGYSIQDGGYNNNTYSSNTDLNNTKSVCQSEQDRPTDQIREKIKEQIEYPFFQLNFSNDLLAVDVLVDYMTELLTSPSTMVNGISQSRQALQSYIDNVDSGTIQEFLQHIQGKELRNIKKPLVYWRSAFVNYLKETALTKASI